MAIYNMSFLDNSTTILQIISGMNTLTGQTYLIGNVLLAFVTLILFFGFFKFAGDMLVALITSTFIGTIVAIMLYASGMITSLTLAFPSGLFALALLIFFIR